MISNEKNVNIVVPMAGLGQRFLNQGYTTPKPLIKINGVHMFEAAIRNFRNIKKHTFIFIIRKEHAEKYSMDRIIKEAVPDSIVIVIDEITQGAICTVLKAEKYIDNEDELIIKDSDQIINIDVNHFLEFMRRNSADGGIATVITSDPGYSFVKVSKNGIITQTAEKIVISNLGSAGMYYFAHGRDLVKYAKNMIAKDIRTNNEFYVCPVYNEFIEDGKLILNYPIAEIFQLGTPEDYERNKFGVKKYLENYPM